MARPQSIDETLGNAVPKAMLNIVLTIQRHVAELAAAELEKNLALRGRDYSTASAYAPQRNSPGCCSRARSSRHLVSVVEIHSCVRTDDRSASGQAEMHGCGA